MAAERFILAIDQGTTSSRAILFDRSARIQASAQQEFQQHYPQPGWVEHDAEEIWGSVRSVVRSALAAARISANDIAAIGITNQRETTVVWDRSGRPVHRAVVWQSRQTEDICEDIKRRNLEDSIRAKTGLVVDCYFSASKLAWLLRRIPDGLERAAAGELLFGTIDSWLVWKLTGGRSHITDCSNASRTLLYNIHSRQWDTELLDAFAVPAAVLPRVVPSSGELAVCSPDLLGAEIPITGIAGDQQAALFGHGCFESGMGKNTYGTGCFMLLNTGTAPFESKQGLLTSIAWELNGETVYCLEGSVFVAGAALQWLRDGLGLIDAAADSEQFALEVSSADGVYFVPAFVGLGAPYWNSRVRGSVFGLTRGTSRKHFVRAALESLAYQTRDVFDAMQTDAGLRLAALKVDGGAAANNFLMQFQADLLGVVVERPVLQEKTALGAAMLAGLAAGFWSGEEELGELLQVDRSFLPAENRDMAEQLYTGWRRAVSAAQAY